MTITVSNEFRTLCREQVTLLERNLGASPIVVYLAEQALGGTDGKLIPVVAEPETPSNRESVEIPLLLDDPNRRDRQLRSALPSSPAPLLFDPGDAATFKEDRSASEGETSPQSHQLVLPLMHDNVVVGLLVTARPGRPWSDGDRETVERTAHTIAIACLLEQRGQWAERNYRQQQQLQTQQHNLLHDWLHQFRNPLSALRIFGKLLTKRLNPDDERRQYADNIVRESDRLQDLLQDFRDAIDTEPFVLPTTVDFETDADEVPKPLPLLPYRDDRRQSVDLHEVIAPLALSARAIASDRHIDFHGSIPDDLPNTQGDRKALVEVVNNLIDNAIKYTPEGGRIRLDAGLFHHDRLGEGVAIAISDTGLGIPPQDLEHLFERRFRGVQADSDIPGTGLGLAIARDLVRQMHGDIEVFSPPQHPWNSFEPSDTGTTFLVWLPLYYRTPDLTG
ncbi:GAF domain-containing sensor histidine kinase [Baaleninema sp.]|uniref:GAF domain-containing sensor histidine kinase n=1 Tax=Baaleninema sp. TaxID=3101197 RepID=UPI003CFDAD72